MESIYRQCLPAGQTCYQVFSESIAGLPNVDVFRGDSRRLQLPRSPLCLAFIDGGHSAECVTHDFHQAWERLSPGGVVALHDFGGDLPEVTAAINKCISSVGSEVNAAGTFPELWIAWVEKAGPSNGGENPQQAPRCSKNDFRMVVASCGEDLSWTANVRGAVTIYDASGAGSFPGVKRVENRAREAGQYLHHIVENYPRFHTWEIFVQGEPFTHSNDPILRGGELDWSWSPFHALGRVVGFNPFGCEHDRWAARFATEWFGGVPAGLQWVVGAQFAINRKLLLNRSIDYWRALQEKALGEEERAPWAMERLWVALI
jgi:hypothetical protein